MGGCCHNPGEYKDMMDERAQKGFSVKMDEERLGPDGKKLRTPGWSEFFVILGLALVVAILWLCGVFAF